MRRYPLENVTNMRDLGGYATADGRVTRYGRFIRSDAPAEISTKELDGLLELGITTVVDLRSPGEAAHSPSVFLQAEAVRIHHHQLDAGIAWPLNEADIPACYLEMVEGPAFIQVLRVLAAAPGAALFHCSAGKDRTGVTAAALLALAGVASCDIIADYEVSYTYLMDRLRRMEKEHPNISAYVGHSRPEFMAGLLEALEERYGGMAPFLLQAGLAPAEMEALRAKLLD